MKKGSVIIFFLIVAATCNTVHAQPVEGTWNNTTLYTTYFDGSGQVISLANGDFAVGDTSSSASDGSYWSITGLTRITKNIGNFVAVSETTGTRYMTSSRSGGTLILYGDTMWGHATGTRYTASSQTSYSETTHFTYRDGTWSFAYGVGSITFSGIFDDYPYKYTLTASIYYDTIYDDPYGTERILYYDLNDCSMVIESTANNAPDPPTPVSPANGSDHVSLTPVLTVSPFADADEGDTHLQTEWQISTSSDFTSTTLQETSTVHLTSLPVPELALEQNTRYYWRARFHDNNDGISDWSYSFSLTTGQVFEDINENGIPDDLENNEADLDGDGTPDIQQKTIKTLNTVVGGGQMGVSISSSVTVTAISRVNAIDPDTISKYVRPKDMDLGLFSFRLTVGNAGDTARVVIYFSRPAPENASWFFYDTINGWVNYDEHATFSPDRESVVLELKDGGYGDADGIANKVIVDPSGFGVASWVTGNVTDAATQAGVSNCTLMISELGLSFSTLPDGSFLSMILPGSYDFQISAPGYQNQALPGIEIVESAVVSQDVALLPNVDISGLTVTGDPDVGKLITFSVEGNASDPIYYRFSMHPDYGTSGYDGRQWSLMSDTEYSTSKSLNHVFTQAGKYIIVVWLSPTSSDVEAQGIPIIGWSVNTEGQACRTNFTGVSIVGTRQVNTPVSISIGAQNTCNSELYYRFSMHPDYGTSGYDGTQWQLMTDTEWITQNTINYSFTKPGKYIVVVWVSDTDQDVSVTGIPIIGWSLDIH